LNPISLIIVIAAVRFGLPAVQALFGSQLDDLSLVRFLRLDRQDWLLGYSIAATGLAALLLGWQASALTRSAVDHSPASRRRQLPSSLSAPILALAAGFLALVAFVVTNGISFVTAVQTGAFRTIEIRPGTGIFFRLSFLLIVGSVVAVHTLLARTGQLDRVPLSAFTPAILAALAFFVLGGRARAFVAIAAAFLLWWYRPSYDEHGRPVHRPGRSLKSKTRVLVCAPLAMILFSFVGVSYRGTDAATGRGAPTNVEEFSRYLTGAFSIDAGALHSLALATRLPPGVLQGRSFLPNLAFPVSEFVTLPGKSTGVYLVEKFVGRSQQKWGVSATIFGEAYTNYGLFGLVLILATVGFLFERLYGRFRSGRTSMLVYALLSVYLLRIVFESIEKWPEALTVLAMLWVVTRVSQSRSAQTPPITLDA
jgi:oligosaccharide repeat unit polymerase